MVQRPVRYFFNNAKFMYFKLRKGQIKEKAPTPGVGPGLPARQASVIAVRPRRRNNKL